MTSPLASPSEPMATVDRVAEAASLRGSVPLSVLVPTRNEGRNIARCLQPLVGWADEIIVVDSGSDDGTVELAEDLGATVVQFAYDGGWPKKRQWALDTHSWRNEWVLLLDADEILEEPVKAEIASAIATGNADAYRLRLRIVFLGRILRFGDTELWKTILFRHGRGRFEKRIERHDASMSDIEIHEHVVVEGSVASLREPIRHENWNTLDRYIAKHNEYSNWEARLFVEGNAGAVTPSLFGSQAQRRRWLKTHLTMLPGSPLLRFLYVYVFRLGFLDGRAGLVYAIFKMIQMFHVKAKIVEARLSAREEATARDE